MVQLRLLGTVDLRDEEGREMGAVLARPKRLALLAYLAAAGPRDFQRRDTLLGLFWPETDSVHARDALNQALHFLRHSLGSGVVVSRGAEEVGLAPERVWCDVAAFRDAAAAGRNAQALELYGGDLLIGFFVDEARAFEEWVEQERAVLRQSAAAAARSLAEEAEQAQSLTVAVSWGRRAFALAGADERALRRLLALLAHAGDRVGALQAYDDFVRRLRIEHEAEPSAETRALADAIRRSPGESAAKSASPSVPAERAADGRAAAITARGEDVQDHQAALVSAPSSGTLTLGSALAEGRYVIERELGHGGMAAVYLARDVRERRRVALKVLSSEVRSERFLREIRIAGRLDHPHVLSLYDSGDSNGLLYFTMPYIAGESLRARLRREHQLTLRDALDITRDVASALDYAHRQAVVHRDIKPENILIENHASEGDAAASPGRRALVADFGIAGAISLAGGMSMEALTRTGTLLGTPHYMSPEQATGEGQVDGRSDIYSLGCVLYEMLAGEPPYTGPTAQSVLARHALAPVPSLRTVRPNVPITVDRAIAKALAKSPADRFRTAGDLVAALEVPDEHASARSRRRATMGAIAAAALGLTALGITRTFEPPPSAPPVRRQLTYVGNAIRTAVSPDGQFLAYLVPAPEAYHVVVQDMAGGAPDTVATIAHRLGASSLEWSPDGTRLLWGKSNEAVVMPRLGGAPRRIDAVQALGGGAVFAHWLPDGRHVSLHADVGNRILVVDLESPDTLWVNVGGKFEVLIDGSWSPSGRLYAVVTGSDAPVRSAIRIVTLDGRTEVVAEDSVQLGAPHWSRKGDAVYFAHGSDAIWRVDVAPRTGQRRGTPREVHSQLEFLPDLGGGVGFSVTGDGKRMAYPRGAEYSNLWIVDSMGVVPKPRTIPLTTGTALRWSPVVSPDGRWIAFAQEANGQSEIFRMPIDGGPASQLTFGARVWRRSWIAWSPDGNRLAFTSVRGGRARVWLASVDGGQPHPLEQTRGTTRLGHLAWAPGSHIAYQTPKLTIDVVDPVSGVAQPLVRDAAPPPRARPGGLRRPPGQYVYYFPQYSPDGGSLALLRWHGKDQGVSVYHFRDSSWTHVSDSLFFPHGWSADGRYVYAQLPWRQPLFRLDVRARRAPEHVLTAPFREVECAPAGPRRPGAFVCVAFDFVSDVWIIDHFDSGAR